MKNNIEFYMMNIFCVISRILRNIIYNKLVKNEKK
jgi:hypothetical protein